MKERVSYHCSEKWNPTHNCKGSKVIVYLLHDDEDVVETKVDLEELKLNGGEHSRLTNTATREYEISLTALPGTPTPHTMILIGKIGDVSYFN